MKIKISFCALALGLNLAVFAQDNYLKIDICENDIPFSFEKGGMALLSDGTILLVQFKDTISPFITIQMDSNLNVLSTGRYQLPEKPTTRKSILEELDTGNRTYSYRRLYICSRTGTWLYYRKNGKLLKRVKY